jgi:hypothetical protein
MTPKSKVISILKTRGINVEPFADDPEILSVKGKVKFGGSEAFAIFLNFYKGGLCQGAVYYVTKKPNIEKDFVTIMSDINFKYFTGKKEIEFKYPYSENDEDREFALANGYGSLLCTWNFALNFIDLSFQKSGELNLLRIRYQDVFHSQLQNSLNRSKSDY